MGSTANTCAIIRTHYSTLEGTAIAYDSYFSWKGWRDYLGSADDKGLARFYQTGLINIYPKGHDPSNHLNLHDALILFPSRRLCSLGLACDPAL